MATRCTCGAVIAEGCVCSLDDTSCFSVGGSGSEENPFTIDAILDPDEDNLMVCGDDGLGAFLPDYIINPPACLAYKTTALATVHDTGIVVPLNAERYDTDSMHDNSTNNERITFNTAGVYTVTFNATWNKDETGDRAIWIRKNGSDFLGSDSKHAGDGDLYVSHSITIQEEFEVADYIEGIAKQDSGGALNLLAGDGSPTLAAVFRRRAT